MAATVDQKLLRQTKFPPEFNQKVDAQKINIEVMKKWIARRLSEILGSEDDVVIELCFNLLESSRYPNIKELQINLTGFLDRDAPKFCKELWNLCLSAQSSPQGVPKELLEAKKQELLQEKMEAQKAADAVQKHKESVTIREQGIDSIRQRERGERAERGGGFRGRGGRAGFESRRPPRSRSPSPPRRRSPYRAPPRDTYIPRGRGGPPRRVERRARSATRSASSSSPSRSPPRRRKDDISRSRSRSPPRKQRRIASRERNGSVEPEGRRKPYKRSARSPTSDVSRSPSPRPRHQRRRQHSLSRSPSPERERRRRRRWSSSASGNDSRKGGRGRGTGRRRPSISSPEEHRSNRRADIVRPRPRRDDPRLSRSPVSPIRRSRRDSSASRSRSRSRSRDRRRDHKRRRSLPRYDPRRRNTSSPPPSSPEPMLEPIREPEPKRRKRDASQTSRSSMADHNGVTQGGKPETSKIPDE